MLPYLFIALSIGLISLWSAPPVKTHSLLRVPASTNDCHQIVKELVRSENMILEKNKSLFRLKNNVWNKIITNREFEQFEETEYFKWIRIYGDKEHELFSQNPISIEQKMALIEVINSKTLMALITDTFSVPALKEDLKKTSALKLKKLANHLEKMDLSSKLTREELHEFSADLFLLLKGPPVSLLDYFSKDKSKLMNKRLFRILQEDMLVMGLRGMLERIPEKESYSRLENGKYMIAQFFQQKFWKYLVLPYDLPWIERVRIPDELLQKIMLDGLDRHDAELIEYLKSQNKIDHYERFRKVYRPVAFSLGFLFYYQKFNQRFNEQMQGEQAEEKRELFNKFGTMIHSLEEKVNVNTEPASLQEQQFNRLLKRYRDEYGEDPSAEDYEALKNQVFRK